MMRDDIVLASASPRRIEMLEKKGFHAQVCPADIDEQLPFDMTAETAVMYLSFAKAGHVAARRRGLVIAADTIVVYDGEIIGKPADEAEAFEVLSRLRGKCHQVITGVCLIDTAGCLIDTAGRGEAAGAGADGATVVDAAADVGGAILPAEAVKLCLYDVTDVYFGDYSDEELRAYVRTPEPYDKAGGYAIQETFGKYIDHIEGDLDNVIGFPLYRVLPYLNGQPLG